MTIGSRLLWGALAAGAVVVLGAISLVGPWGSTASIPVSTARRGEFVHRVEAEGVLEAEEATVLTVPVDAPSSMTIAWLAPDGRRVEEGEVVVRFDSAEMRQQLLDGRAEKAKAESRRARKEIEEEVAVENLGRDAALADLQLEYSRTFQSKDSEIFSRMEIVESEIDRILARERKSHVGALQEVRRDLGEVELELLDLEKRKAELEIERAEAGLERLEIRAPHDGIFVLRRDWGGAPRVGEQRWPGMPVAEIPSLDRMKARVFVLEADAGGVEPGVAARVVLEAHPDRPVEGTVRSVSAVATRRSRYSPVQYFEVEIELQRSMPELMKPGQRVRATLTIQDLDDVLTVPREAIFDGEGEARRVYRQAGGGFVPVQVSVGPMALGRAVIESGLGEGDVVALQDPTRARGPEEDRGEPGVEIAAPEVSS